MQLKPKKPSPPDPMREKIRSDIDRLVDEANSLSMCIMQSPCLQLRFQDDLQTLFFMLMMLSDERSEKLDIEREISNMSDTIAEFKRAIMMAV